MAKRIRMECDTCGSDDVLADASAFWGTDEQTWMLAEWLETAWCNKCEDETKIKEVEIHENDTD